MSNYVKQTWIDGNPSNPVSAARMGVIEQGIFDAHFQPAARVFNSANQAIATSTPTVLAFDSERFDTDTIHDTVTNNSRLTCKTAGIYLIIAQVNWNNFVPGFTEIRLNGATAVAETAVNANYGDMNVATVYQMAVNDYVEVVVQQTSGSSQNVIAQANQSPEFMIARLA